MKPALARPIALFLTMLISVPQSFATCGGGGGGGRGGISPSGADSQQVFNVPWKLRTPDAPPVTAGLVLYWFPASKEELANSSLRVSRQLSLYATQCVTMEVADVMSAPGKKFAADAKLPIAVIATPDGTLVSKIDNSDGKLRVEQVEKMVESELKNRESNLEQQLKQAKERAKSGDNISAIPLYRSVYDQKCLFPKKAKEAAKELKKLGVNDVADIVVPLSPIFDKAVSAKIDQAMLKGLAAEEKGHYVQARALYQQAHELDPADPTPLRYLGEVYRHHTGEWDKARTTFEAILRMPADPMSRAVALHGLGKMTIHEGEFKKGLKLMEDSVKEYPLALAYRNLAVYWNSEGDQKQADSYTRQALALDPTDPYNLIFAAAFMAGTGHGDEALAIAKKNEAFLPASYNLAAIYAQAGQRDKALSLLKRHFFEYERYQEVRTKEMMEARVDAVFASLRTDPEFLALTSGADGRLPMPMSPKAAERPAAK
jgi:tetratricopeptide (TPR) repeat protein